MWQASQCIKMQMQASGLHWRCKMQENAGLRPALEMQMQAFGLRLGLNGECAFASLVLWLKVQTGHYGY